MWKQKIFSRKDRNISIQTKLIGIFFAGTIIIFFVNMYMYMNFNKMIQRIDRIYEENSNLVELQNGLNQVQTSMSEYLNTKSSDSLEDYFRSEEAYAEQIQGLNALALHHENLIMEKNIRSMSETYLELTADIISAKRGRNVEKYKVLYEKASEIHSYIETYIYTLNNMRFQNNAESYSALYSALKNSRDC